MILAAGRGERMRPLTDKTPKPLLQVAGKPLIQYHVERLVDAGLRDIVVNASWLADQLRDFLGDGSAFGAQIQLSLENPALETAGGIVQALPLLGDDPFVVINGDVWADYDVAGLASRSLESYLAHLVLTVNPPHHPAGDFALRGDGVLDLRGARRYTFAGISLMSPALFAGQPQGPAPLGPLLQRRAADVTGEIFDGLWFDVGTVERLSVLERSLAGQGRTVAG